VASAILPKIIELFFMVQKQRPRYKRQERGEKKEVVTEEAVTSSTKLVNHPGHKTDVLVVRRKRYP
jgi:hypothetical protein